MLNSYKDACALNEAHVFYATSTNTFRNPIFEPQIESLALNGPNNVAPAPKFNIDQANNGTAQRDLPNATLEQQQQQQEGEEDYEQADQEEEGESSQRSLQKSCSNNMSFSSNHSELGQRWHEFCDNLSLSIKGRLFIMESNFKRRLRAMRKYLDKRMPWILPQLKSHSSRSRRASSSRQQQQQQQLNCEAAHLQGFGHFQFPEPNSSKSLDAQQECLLNRLERIKRQRLFANLSTPVEHLASDVQDASHHDDDDEVAEEEDFGGDLSEGMRTSSSNERPQEGNSTGRANASLAPLLLEQDGGQHQTARPLGLFAAVDQVQPAAQAQGKSKLKLGERSRWISRSGRHIRDTALAFTSSKKSCIVCYERPANIVTLPCKHSDICSECFIEIIYMAVKQSQYPLKCVLCRQKVERIRCSRRLLLSVIEKNRARC